MAKRPLLHRGGLCHAFATKGVEALRRLVQPRNLLAQICVGLTDVRVPQQVRYFVKLETALVPPRSSFASEIVEGEIDPSRYGNDLLLWFSNASGTGR